MDLKHTVSEDFERELSSHQFPFHDIVTGKTKYLDLLYNEFSLLVPRPKFQFYFNEFISDDDWAKDRLENRGYPHTSSSSRTVVANFVAMSELEIKAERLHTTFQEKIVKNTVEEKYRGRFIVDMTTYKILKKIESNLDDFKRYVLTDDNINNYGAYARAAAKKIILQINKLNIELLKLDLLEFIIEISPDDDFKLLLLFSPYKSHKHDQLISNFNYLKTHADELFLKQLRR